MRTNLYPKLYRQFPNNFLRTYPEYNGDSLDYTYPNYYWDPLYNCSKYSYSTRKLLFLKDPRNNGTDLQVNMLRGISHNEDNLQQGEPSTDTEEPSNLNRGKKRQLESENTCNNESTGTSQVYPLYWDWND